MIEGKQEIRVNFEVRELIVAGVIRPEDIESDNTIESTKIAQARIAYGGRGQITDVQQRATASRSWISCCRSDPHPDTTSSGAAAGRSGSLEGRDAA